MTGSGTVGDPYIIYNVTDLQAMDDADKLSSYFELANNINASATQGWDGGKGFMPIGDTPSGEEFTGHFDGKGYRITDLWISRLSKNYVGLFGYPYTGSTITNVTLVDPHVGGGDYVGALVGYPNSSNITYCAVTGGIVLGHNYTGGFAGSIGVISKCLCTFVDIYIFDAPEASFYYAGGFGGYNHNNATDCYSIGCDIQVNAFGRCRIGGFSPQQSATGGLDRVYAVNWFTGGTPAYGRCGIQKAFTTYVQDSFFNGDLFTSEGSGCAPTERSTSVMKTKSNYTDANWDFDTVWDIDSDLNNGYPFLRPPAPQPAGSPTVTTDAATSITGSSAILNGTLDDDGGEPCDSSFQYGLTTSYGSATSTQSKSTGESFESSIAGLLPGITYHFRAKATNSEGTGYGEDLTFTTLGNVFPSIGTTRVSSLVHRWVPGNFTLEMVLGGVTSEFGLIIPTGRPTPTIPTLPSCQIDEVLTWSLEQGYFCMKISDIPPGKY